MKKLPKAAERTLTDSKMKITKRQLRRIIKEEVATVNKDAIEDTVMDILSDEGGASGIEPIEDALEDLEDDEISLPEEPIEDLVGSVAGVKRHADGDYVDTTQLEGRLRGIVREALSTMVPDIAPRRKSSFQAHKERKDASMAADMAKMDAFIKQVADQLKADPASAGDILTTFQPAIELDKHQQSMEGGLRIDAFLDKVEEDLQAQGVDRVAALKFSDSFFKFR